MKKEDFDAYIRQVEPSSAESAKAWQTAIGLQSVDGLRPSEYLLETAKKNIEGDITIEEVRQLLDSYYKKKTARTKDDDDSEEADKVAANIKKILSTNTLAFNANGFISVHRRIFEGVFKHAGQLRDYDITKKEWVLRGGTVNYLNWEDLRQALDYDIRQEKEFSYKGLSDLAKIRHISQFVAGLWQIHPFGEGNTRTTAVFTIQYLRSLGFEVDNTPFAEHSWYFRNALVRANYKDANKGIDYTCDFLERFFRNLLLGEHNELKNRCLLIDAPEFVSFTDDKTDDKPTINDDKPSKILILLKEKGECKTAEIADSIGLKTTQTKAYLYMLVKQGLVEPHGANRNRTYRLKAK